MPWSTTPSRNSLTAPDRQRRPDPAGAGDRVGDLGVVHRGLQPHVDDQSHGQIRVDLEGGKVGEIARRVIHDVSGHQAMRGHPLQLGAVQRATTRRAKRRDLGPHRFHGARLAQFARGNARVVADDLGCVAERARAVDPCTAERRGVGERPMTIVEAHEGRTAPDRGVEDRAIEQAAEPLPSQAVGEQPAVVGTLRGGRCEPCQGVLEARGSGQVRVARRAGAPQCVAVRIDEPRHDDPTAPVDHLGAATATGPDLDLVAHRHDAAVADGDRAGDRRVRIQRADPGAGDHQIGGLGHAGERVGGATRALGAQAPRRPAAALRRDRA